MLCLYGLCNKGVINSATIQGVSYVYQLHYMDYVTKELLILQQSKVTLMSINCITWYLLLRYYDVRITYFGIYLFHFLFLQIRLYLI